MIPSLFEPLKFYYISKLVKTKQDSSMQKPQSFSSLDMSIEHLLGKMSDIKGRKPLEVLAQNYTIREVIKFYGV